MRLSDLVGKEIVNITSGARLGTVGDSDLIIDETTGEIDAIILPQKGNLVGFWTDREPLIIPWDAVVKIGAEVVIVELDDTYQRYSRRFTF
ncbi:YlmC/YmxH family sporulation protein [Heliobacillus mobilis]|uniref:YlmC/YmxH family sporulation protein n=2 Tax=Heliobacterium TaxID=2697 RepID=A0A6I3SNB5_HELMO|nr:MULTISPECIES: YlmC/YmxH family sporulation protein [Heliobacterium]MBC9786029.1 YlmC/YmxH family sporulation protein [Heliobacterium chlorum]MTV50478.1 YlmC/YmxH family sporulation protein [Heliobacterium mobile]